MRLLLDTHALLWWIFDDPKLSAPARAAIANAENVIHVSAASAWEIAIKQALGKLRTTREPAAAVAEGGFSALPITFEHAAAVVSLATHHHDPFDRLILAVAQVEGLTIVTSDDRFGLYGEPLIDARS